MRILITTLVFLLLSASVLCAQETQSAETDSTLSVQKKDPKDGGQKKTDRLERQVIKLEESQVEGKLSRPQVVFLLQHNEHAYRTFNIKKDMSGQLRSYRTKNEMLKQYKMFYVDRLKERVW
ncbi:MAG: hypothetical protein B6244_09015 [Candidatus Cloacimonetes bacterium 4572_55]|nr:MAG: hypothetical protein B6244_09015 [Candidatus Cloacimonetes bacterium 4572_55]